MIKPLNCPVCDHVLPPQLTMNSPEFPFCSSRCKNVDLFRWGEGKYAIVEDLAERPDILEQILEDDVFSQSENEDEESY